jgi:hypothetical protein
VARRSVVMRSVQCPTVHSRIDVGTTAGREIRGAPLALIPCPRHSPRLQDTGDAMAGIRDDVDLALDWRSAGPLGCPGGRPIWLWKRPALVAIMLTVSSERCPRRRLNALGSSRTEQCFSDGGRITPVPATMARRQDAGRLCRPGRQRAVAGVRVRPSDRSGGDAGEGAHDGRGAAHRHQHRAPAGAAREGGERE